MHPRQGNISGCDRLSRIIAPQYRSLKGRAYRRVPPQVCGRPCRSIIDSRVCHRAQLAKAGSESMLIAHACAVVAPSLFRLPLSQPRMICTRNTVYSVFKVPVGLKKLLHMSLDFWGQNNPPHRDFFRKLPIFRRPR